MPRIPQDEIDRLKAEVAEWEARPDGTVFAPGDVLASFTGTSRAVLTGERTARDLTDL